VSLNYRLLAGYGLTFRAPGSALSTRSSGAPSGRSACRVSTTAPTKPSAPRRMPGPLAATFSSTHRALLQGNRCREGPVHSYPRGFPRGKRPSEPSSRFLILSCFVASNMGRVRHSVPFIAPSLMCFSSFLAGADRVALDQHPVCNNLPIASVSESNHLRSTWRSPMISSARSSSTRLSASTCDVNLRPFHSLDQMAVKPWCARPRFR
jgi:hypothetical protein